MVIAPHASPRMPRPICLRQSHRTSLERFHQRRSGTRPEEHRGRPMAYHHLPQSTCSRCTRCLRSMAEPRQWLATVVQRKTWILEMVEEKQIPPILGLLIQLLL